LQTGFRLVPTSVTLNDLERRNSPHFALFHGIRRRITHSGKTRPILSTKYRLPLLAKTDPPCSVVSAIAELLAVRVETEMNILRFVYVITVPHHESWNFTS